MHQITLRVKIPQYAIHPPIVDAIIGAEIKHKESKIRKNAIFI